MAKVDKKNRVRPFNVIGNEVGGSVVLTEDGDLFLNYTIGTMSGIIKIKPECPDSYVIQFVGCEVAGVNIRIEGEFSVHKKTGFDDVLKAFSKTGVVFVEDAENTLRLAIVHGWKDPEDTRLFVKSELDYHEKNNAESLSVKEQKDLCKEAEKNKEAIA